MYADVQDSFFFVQFARGAWLRFAAAIHKRHRPATRINPNPWTGARQKPL
jgi:hypothetical protein